MTPEHKALATSPINRITIVGLGLLGASLASILSKRSGIHITGISSEATLQEAMKEGIIHRSQPYSKILEAPEYSDLIILCTPIVHIQEVLKKWTHHPIDIPHTCIITDVGSTKQAICEQASQSFQASPNVHFIGSHPMAGSEQSGIHSRDPLLFENASWILCPNSDSSQKHVRSLQMFAESLGSHVAILSPEEHDQTVAQVSHLPQLLSTALAGFASNQPNIQHHGLKIAGSGFRDMTRLAASTFSIWEPIINTNQSKVIASLQAYMDYLGEILGAVTNRKLEPYFEKAFQLRHELVTNNSGFASNLSEVLVSIPDKPGVLHSLLKPFAEENINVLDLEILKVREGEFGTLRLAFKRHEEATKAVAILQKNNYEARIR
jgi:prephenate dehydrogenase